jgi:hypothetical protein
MTRNAIAKEIVDAAFRIHTTLGTGLLESVLRYVSPIKDGCTRASMGWKTTITVE